MVRFEEFDQVNACHVWDRRFEPHFRVYDTYVKRVSQRSAESRGLPRILRFSSAGEVDALDEIVKFHLKFSPTILYGQFVSYKLGHERIVSFSFS